MKKTKKILSVLLCGLMLVSLLSVGVFAAEGDQSDPINANDKWFGYGVDCFLLNTTLDAGDTDGVWYELTADASGILQLEHSYSDVDYQITVNVNGQVYLGYEHGVYNMPIITLPVAVNDVISIHIVAQDTALSGMVYCNAKFVTGANDPTQTIKLKNAGVKVWIANGTTVYFQDDSLQAEYAAKGLELVSSATEGITVTSASKTYTDTDGDGIVELVLGGSAGSAGAPPVKPAFAITNQSGADAWFVLNVADTAHECVYDNDADTDCNTCGAVREVIIPPSCEHTYVYDCDTACTLCGEVTRPDAQHAYTHSFDAYCNYCDLFRSVSDPMGVQGTSIREEGTGLAVGFHMMTTGMDKNGYTAIYDNATVDGYKLVTMGAIVSNKMKSADEKLTMDMVDGNRVLNITANYLYDLIPQAGVAFFKVSINNIPEEYKDTYIGFQPYFVLEDANGQQHIVYSGRTVYESYNTIANR